MKGHIAFCPHFHQPHFQLYRTREEAYANSYEPWLKLLRDASKLESFFINLHFSGPFLYWMRAEKPEFLAELNELLVGGKLGLIGGLADEPFIQLSSRPDDYLYQLRQYDELLQDTLGIDAGKWQGIHLVERECGEVLLQELARGAGLLQASPIFYLDQETFYPAHFAYPGSASDYCLRHFGFQDPVSITTISHMPPEMLHYALRDEIGGQEYYALPIHSQFRYQLLKRQSFTASDHSRIKPGHYYFYIKDTLEKAARMAQAYGREIEPVLVIFEDAEKFGQWSKDPVGDSEWLMEFFSLVDKDPELRFTGMKEYVQNQGFLDTYPARSSHSYPEWENWTAQRGIRGVTFGDERLRRVMCRIRDLEVAQSSFENVIINSWQDKHRADLPFTGELLAEALLQSARRFELVLGILREDFNSEVALAYELLNRVRHLVYQEDPKWASRHPSYGSSPYYDAQGLSYLELALSVLQALNSKMGVPAGLTLQIRDWDFDGRDEVVLQSEDQCLVLHRDGGCVAYHHVLSLELCQEPALMMDILRENIQSMKAYHSIHRHLTPLVFTESDSSLVRQFYPEGGRREVCRNSWRCGIMREENGSLLALGTFETLGYDIERETDCTDGSEARLSCTGLIETGNGAPARVSIVKSFRLEAGSLLLKFTAKCEGDSSGLYLVPQMVISAAPSDEMNFRPRAFLGIVSALEPKDTQFVMENLACNRDGGFEFYSAKTLEPKPVAIDYIYEVCCGEGSAFNNRVRLELDSANPMPFLQVQPAVKEYYQDYVFPGQSSLGYHTSGIMLSPALLFAQGRAEFSARISWELASDAEPGNYGWVIDLIR